MFLVVATPLVAALLVLVGQLRLSNNAPWLKFVHGADLMVLGAALTIFAPGMPELKAIPGLVMLLIGADYMVAGASSLATKLGISAMMVGLTIVSIGTSAPEAAVTILAGLKGSADLGLGNVVGSNIANIGLVLGISAQFAVLLASRILFRFDIPFMIGMTVLTGVLALDGALSWIDGLIFLIAYAAYFGISIRREIGGRNGDGNGNKAQQKVSAALLFGYSGLIVTGIAGLVYGSSLVVGGASALAIRLGLSEMVVGLTVVAIGTSLPEVVTSVVAVIRGERDLAVGNVVGSNIANLGLVLGLGAISAGNIPVSDSVLRFDFIVALLAALMVWVMMWSRNETNRVEGLVLLVGYVLYLMVVTGKAMGLSALAAVLNPVAIGFAVVAAAVILAEVIRHHRPARSN